MASVAGVARLGTAERARLPDSAFAYVDAEGHRRLPIHDEAHVRNALARFNQVRFDDVAARDRALARLLKAAKKYRLVPVGFIATQLQSEREQGRGGSERGVQLPSGFVTMLMTDIEGSTELVSRLGDSYGALLEGVQAALQAATLAAGGHVVEVRADELFAVFEAPTAAVQAAINAQRELADRQWAEGSTVRVRVGIHAGYPTRVRDNYIGLAVHVTARVCGAAHGGQVLVSGDTKTALTGMQVAGVRFRNLGEHRLRGVSSPVPLYQVAAKGLVGSFPPLRTSRAGS